MQPESARLQPLLQMRAGFAALLWLGAAGLAAAQSQEDSEIVVTAERLRELTHDYTAEVAAAPNAAEQYPRWNFRLCPSVAGVASSDAQTLIDHMALRAHEVGVDTERTGCQPNLVIIFAPDPSALARQIVDTRRDLLGYYDEDDTVTAGREELESFVSSARPVRWWHVARATTADGQQLGESRTRTGRSTRAAVAAAQGNVSEAATAGSGFEGVEAVRSSGTRTRRDIRHDISFALLLVDARRAAELPPQAVADYLAMAALVQLNPDADLSGFPSILNLFAEPAAGGAPLAGMTDWDRAYLRGLYAARREAASLTQQQNDIARRMAERLANE